MAIDGSSDFVHGEKSKRQTYCSKIAPFLVAIAMIISFISAEPPPAGAAHVVILTNL